MIVKRLSNKLLSPLGYEIIKKSNRRVRKNTGQSYALLKKLGFSPRTIIDVGVAKGTPALYDSFSDAYLLLIEPLIEYVENLKTILRQREGSYVNAAAGSVAGTAKFYKHLNHLSGSSLYRETMGDIADGQTITVSVIKLDDVIAEKDLEGPFLVKIDTQGSELDVLDGFRNSLPKTEAVVLEVSMFEFMQGAPQFYDVVHYMKQRNFVAYDIILGWNRPLDDALGQVDIVFVKENGIFRKKHAYSTIDQLNKLFGC